ncbi:unnamed protein product [Pipistrellus nathusii]|uniref:Uncharacterized protein n=1 Tax=Pipistrellus nathusii TaxID=59473 RepID=A0ABP0ALW0_PIPNA
MGAGGSAAAGTHFPAAEGAGGAAAAAILDFTRHFSEELFLVINFSGGRAVWPGGAGPPAQRPGEELDALGGAGAAERTLNLFSELFEESD